MKMAPRLQRSFLLLCFSLCVCIIVGSSFATAGTPYLSRAVRPALQTWKEAVRERREARCATRVQDLMTLHRSPAEKAAVLSSIPMVCRAPIAVIASQEHEMQECPSCARFTDSLLEPLHLSHLQALRQSQQISVVLHLGEEELAEVISTQPLPTGAEEELSLMSSKEDGAAAAAAGRRAVAQYWERLRRSDSYQRAAHDAYAGYGEYALRVLFLWPFNGTVMPIVSPDWIMYAARPVQLNDDTALEGAGDGISHMYLSASDFLQNCVFAWEMVQETLLQ